MTPEPVRAQVETLRRKLLDLSLRNRMLNYRPSKRLGVTLVGEDSFNVHRILVEEGKRMTFVGKADPPKGKPNLELPGMADAVAMAEARRAAEEEMDAFLENAAMPVDQMDTKLSAEEFESVLQPKLRTIAREASLANDELGINTLFLALGQLEWSEVDTKPYRAPLLFVPVALDRQANGSVRLSHSGGDVGDNLPLRAKLAEFNLKLPEYDDEKGILDYFEEIASTVRSRTDWQVLPNEICLGFFNYEKYAMYVDLGGEAWPDGRKPWDHADVSSMLAGGYPPLESSVDEDTFMDDVRPVAECHEVYDADSSQTLAMIRAESGLSIVIEGPPGTGKSQTITNIIAEAVAAGKSVLFVSAKRAALEVVKRRLEEAELGSMCLDLHDKLTNRREFYQELKRTVGRAITIRNEEERVARLTELRDKLNAHAKSVNEPLPEFGTTPFVAMASLARLPQETPEDREGRVPFESIRHLKESDVRAAMPSLEALQTRIKSLGLPIEHPFWGVAMDYLDPARKLDLQEDLEAADRELRSAIESIVTAAAAFRIAPPATPQDVRVLRLCAERAISAPPLDGVALKAESWQTEEQAIRSSIEAIRIRNGVRQKVLREVNDSIWTVDLAAVQADYDEHAGKWYRFLIGAFRGAKATLRPHLTGAAPTDAAAQGQLVRFVRSAQDAEASIQRNEPTLRRLFGVQWQGLETDPDVLERLLSWVLSLLNDVQEGQIPNGLLDFFTGDRNDTDLLPLVVEAERRTESAIQAYRKAADTLAYPFVEEPLEEIRQRVVHWSESLDLLPEFIAFSQARKDAESKGLASVVAVADRWPLAAQKLREAFLRSYYGGIVRVAMEARPDLRAFEREGHEAAIAEFQNLDDFKLRYNRARVRLAHHRQLPSFHDPKGNLLLLKVQTELTRKHKPIRWIMARAGEAIQRIKPVFMMSPLSVAIHLPPELPPFDMVVFDEASQIRPEDALSAIVRARQAIVVGDTRQMPPTSFFDRVADDEVEDEEASDLAQTAQHLESVLNLVSAAVTGRERRPDLQWHYRSLHPALIQPSNEMFYESRLVVFPSASPEQGGRKVGVVFHHDPLSVYESGARSRVNRQEAGTVADAVLRHVQTTPEESLMVAAMNKPQADLIYEEVLKRERANPEPFQNYRSKHPHEPLDVKNLENVQGDERDVVFISVTYGRDAEGTIRQQFGPLLRDGGERRLNVLITRARRRCEVFSNLTADDLRAEPGSLGVLSLKRYLAFAATGSLEVPIVGGEEEDSPLENEIATELRNRGFEVDPQVGSEGYRVDLAVKDPNRPDRYILGIECDGATYHNARSARDRDKLRQRVLEVRGWRIHRIWSHDWWQDREGELSRLIEALSRVQEREAEDEQVLEEEVHPETFVQESTKRETPKETRPYVETPPLKGMGSPIDYVHEIIRQEGPITEELLLSRVRAVAGLSRVTKNAKAWLQNLLQQGVATGRIVQAGNAYHTPNTPISVPRDWSTRPASERKTDLVPDIEIQAALSVVVKDSYGIERDAAVKGALNLIGFKRVTEDALDRGRELVAGLIEKGTVLERDGLLVLP